MKYFYIVLISFCTFSFSVKAQNNDSKPINLPLPVAPLTEIMIQKHYSVAQQKQLATAPTKVKLIDYLFSKSFEVVSGQEFTNDQFEKIDVINLDLNRKTDENVVFFDETSGLNLVLYSINTVELEKSKIDPSYIPLNKTQIKSTN